MASLGLAGHRCASHFIVRLCLGNPTHRISRSIRFGLDTVYAFLPRALHAIQRLGAAAIWSHSLGHVDHKDRFRGFDGSHMVCQRPRARRRLATVCACSRHGVGRNLAWSKMLPLQFKGLHPIFMFGLTHPKHATSKTQLAPYYSCESTRSGSAVTMKSIRRPSVRASVVAMN